MVATCPLCGSIFADSSVRTISKRRQSRGDMNAPEHLLNDDGELIVQEYEHGRDTSGMVITVKRRCTIAQKARDAQERGDLPEPLVPALSGHKTDQTDPEAPSAGCGTYPFVGETRKVRFNSELTEITEKPDDTAIVDWQTTTE